MPGSPKEVTAARAEGVEFRFLLAPAGFASDARGRLAAVHAQRMELGEPDAGGRRAPRAVPGSPETIPADTAVLAFGFRPDAARLARTFGVATTPEGALRVDPLTGATSRPRVFAAGDAAHGADLVCTAVASGRRAAAAIHRLLTQAVPA